jgi:hypothetical protein
VIYTLHSWWRERISGVLFKEFLESVEKKEDDGYLDDKVIYNR